MLIEKVTGRPLAQALRADLFTPAGLRRVAVQDADRPTPPLALPPARLGISPDGYLPSRSQASAAFSAGGLAADAPTIAQWGYQLYGTRVLSAHAVRAMTTQQSPRDIFPPDVGYGTGTMIFHQLQYSVRDSIGHSGGIPGFLSLLAVVPERHLSVALLIDDDNKTSTES